MRKHADARACPPCQDVSRLQSIRNVFTHVAVRSNAAIGLRHSSYSMYSFSIALHSKTENSAQLVSSSRSTI